VCAPGEVIHLKNGRKIWADQVRDTGTRLEYDVGEDSYAIPKSSVDHVESGGTPPQIGAAPSRGQDLPDFSPNASLKSEAALSERIVRDGKLDLDALSALEAEGNPAATATGYFIAGKYQFEHGDISRSQSFLETALRFDAENPTILTYYAAALLRKGEAASALSYAERAVRIAPDAPDALDVLGYAQYASGHSAEAIQSWKNSLAVRPDATVQQYLNKAQREANAEANFSQNESSHFSLRYEGKESSDQLRQQILSALESDYDDLVRDLGVEPRNISVELYTGQAFFDVTQAPSWTGAVNDGKLRIPVEGLSSVTPELAHVLKHELAHSFIRQVSAGRCPQWLNEGVAQILEPKSVASNGHMLARLFQSGQAIPFNVLEGSFMNLSTIQAEVAYAESLAATEYINDTYGMSDVRRILERLGQGSSTEAALRTTIHSDYGQLQDEVGKYLAEKYGN